MKGFFEAPEKNMGVFKYSGTPKWMVSNGTPYLNG